MKLLRKPFKPTSLPFAPIIRRGDVPCAWAEYLGAMSRTASVGEDDARVA